MLKAHGKKNLLLCPSYVMPVMAKCPTFLIHHGSYEGYRQAFSWWKLNKARAVYALSAKRATALSTVSEHSKWDIVRFYGVDPEKINVVPDGVHTRVFRELDERWASCGVTPWSLHLLHRFKRRRQIDNWCLVY